MDSIITESIEIRGDECYQERDRIRLMNQLWTVEGHGDDARLDYKIFKICSVIDRLQLTHKT